MLLSLFKLICRYVSCSSDCGGKENSDSVKENHKKRKKNSDMKQSFTDEDDLYML